MVHVVVPVTHATPNIATFWNSGTPEARNSESVEEQRAKGFGFGAGPPSRTLGAVNFLAAFQKGKEEERHKETGLCRGSGGVELDICRQVFPTTVFICSKPIVVQGLSSQGLAVVKCWRVGQSVLVVTTASRRRKMVENPQKESILYYLSWSKSRHAEHDQVSSTRPWHYLDYRCLVAVVLVKES
jgi:hypothetical protein